MTPRRFASRSAMATLVALAPVTTGGCSLLLTQGPPEGYEQMDNFTCTESITGPTVDLVMAGLGVLVVVAAAEDSDVDYETDDASKYFVTTFAVLGAVSAVSAVVGFNNTKKCRAAKRELAERRSRAAVAAQRQGPAEQVVHTVVLRPPADTLTIGEQVQLTATAYDSAGAAVTNTMFAWSSSNDGIASVSNAGLVSAHANGAVVIAAHADNIVGTASIVVITRR